MWEILVQPQMFHSKLIILCVWSSLNSFPCSPAFNNTPVSELDVFHHACVTPPCCPHVPGRGPASRGSSNSPCVCYRPAPGRGSAAGASSYYPSVWSVARTRDRWSWGPGRSATVSCDHAASAWRWSLSHRFHSGRRWGCLMSCPHPMGRSSEIVKTKPSACATINPENIPTRLNLAPFSSYFNLDHWIK